jgi:2-polyprenyl-3-methyl-5-hydroxy-6-metoxy-1,4-benzoquinol methylase
MNSASTVSQSLDYLDLVFDCHEMDKLDAIKDNSIDVITLTNVLHHLKSPITFLNRAASKLKSGDKVIAAERFFPCYRLPFSSICTMNR